ncbi:BSD domain-containing protein 1-like [Impatiens glandulifera]|uniref:BSD domain-containing protein 1-like n=1 Tax=Impatiens glandulifera TaxID=253017 RepID=UPI001FB05700|nr:BSD domain-containing protein 1-like [Impatiens glandulifera]
MNFFKSVFSEDLQPFDPEDDTLHSPSKSKPKDPIDESCTSEVVGSPRPMSSISGIANAWSFGGLMKTLATKSESVIETYRRDLEEFGTGLRKETAVIREVAGRAVRDLPASLEAGAAVAQESLESVGQVIDVFGNTVTEIISHGKDSILAGDSDAESSDFKQYSAGSSQQNLNLNSKPYSRLDAQIRSIQCDLKTYCEQPDELDEFKDWKLGFLLEEKSGEIENLIEENGVIDDIHKEIVPSKVDDETFWSRYFFRAYKLRKAEDARSELVKRAISMEEEEDLSWDVEEDDYVEEELPKRKVEQEKEVAVAEPKEAVYGEEMHPPDVKSGSEGGKTENGESCKDSDLSVVSTQPSLNDEEDLSWDEIEDSDETTKAATTSESPNKAEIRKRLSGMEEEEDLSWDIEDDDEPLLVKS